jgi:hypothetical protein
LDVTGIFAPSKLPVYLPLSAIQEAGDFICHDFVNRRLLDQRSGCIGALLASATSQAKSAAAESGHRTKPLSR